MAKIIQIHEGVIINSYSIDKKKMIIGRKQDCDIVIDDKTVSMEHALVEVISSSNKKGRNEYFIKDLDSTNSTYINDKEIDRQKLKNDDLIRIGWSTFRFIDEKKAEKTLKIHKSWIPGVFYTKE